MMLIAGPVRGGTNDDERLIKGNIDAMTDVGDEIYDEIQHPIAEKPLQKRDGPRSMRCYPMTLAAEVTMLNRSASAASAAS